LIVPLFAFIAWLTVIIFSVIFAADLLPKWKSTGVKEKIIYCTLMLLSFGVLVLYTFSVKIPTPTTPIVELIDTLFPTLNK
jgi:hypothetical protein